MPRTLTLMRPGSAEPTISTLSTFASPMNYAGPPQQPVFRFNPYVRSPRDFFMWGDMMEDQIARERRPALVP